MIWEYLEKWDRFDLDDEDLREWVDRFRSGKWEAGLAYWEELSGRHRRSLPGWAEAIPEIVSPYQAAKMDVMEKR